MQQQSIFVSETLESGMSRVAFAVSGDSEGTIFLDELERHYKAALEKVCVHQEFLNSVNFPFAGGWPGPAAGP